MADGSAGVSAGATASSAPVAESAAQTTQSAPKNETEQNEESRPTGKQRLLERYAKQYPDRKFEGDNADEDLYSLTADEFDKYDKESEENAKYKERSAKLNKLFSDYPESADIFRAMAVDKVNPEDYIFEKYGEKVRDLLDSDQGRAKLRQMREDKDKSDAERKAYDEERDSNFRDTISRLGEWGKRNNLDEDTQVKHYMRIRDAANDFFDGKISDDLFDLFLRGANYDSDVAQAREEGEVNGRNAKIKSEFQQSKAKRVNPPTLSGQGGGSEEYDMGKDKGVLPMFGIPISKKK